MCEYPFFSSLLYMLFMCLCDLCECVWARVCAGQAWRRRACVLEGQSLRYFKGDDATGAPKGVVSLVRGAL